MGFTLGGIIAGGGSFTTVWQRGLHMEGTPRLKVVFSMTSRVAKLCSSKLSDRFSVAALSSTTSAVAGTGNRRACFASMPSCDLPD
jgi:hypothetical protein